MKIAVVGASGVVGRAIVAEALARGHGVTAISRRPERPQHHRTRFTIGHAEGARNG